MNKSQIAVVAFLSCAIVGLFFQGRMSSKIEVRSIASTERETFSGPRGTSTSNLAIAEPPKMRSDFDRTSQGSLKQDADGFVTLVSFVADDGKKEIQKIVEKGVNGSGDWTWQKKLHPEGIWLRSKSNGTDAGGIVEFEMETEFNLGELPNNADGVKLLSPTATESKTFQLQFSKSGTFDIVAKAKAKELTISINSQSDRGVQIHVPDNSQIPVPPEITRYRRGDEYPFEDYKTATNEKNIFRTSNCAIEARVFAPGDEIKGVILHGDGSNSSYEVQAVCQQGISTSSNTNDFRSTISFDIDKTLNPKDSGKLYANLLCQSSISKNHRFGSKLILNPVTAPILTTPRVATIDGRTSPALLNRKSGGSQIVLNSVASDPAAVAIFIDGQFVGSQVSSAGTVNFDNFNLPEGQHILTAKVLNGNAETNLKSAPFAFEARTGQFNVVNVMPKDFGARLGSKVVEITFSRPVDATIRSAIEASASRYAYIQISSSGTAEGPFIPSDNLKTPNCKFEKNGTKLTMTYSLVDPGLHRLTLVGREISDVFGNNLDGNGGKPGEDYEVILGAAATSAGISDPLVPGVTRGNTPIVEYPSVIPSKEQPRGFNPNDRVEARVARLYFYRDAHRVAQILNRRTQSYNRQDVTMRKQMADKARQEAESLTTQRQISERDAVEKARRTREYENQLSEAQRTLNYSLQQMQQLAVQPISDPKSDAAKRREAQLTQLEIAARSNAEQVRALESKIESARDVEVASNERWQQAQRTEELSRAEQFRLETAAAHSDPDTFAEGKPDSVDAVHQVSISVIGEGILHLRGPLRGVNQVRMMVDQIDSPCGQVRVNVHSTQINGEAPDELETVANRIQTYIDQARFLTLQSGEMLRKAVLHTAAARAEEARGLYPGESQADRDQRYLIAFFGKDFVDELRAMDSEFLQTGNKLLSLHSMDVTSLSSALTMIALANNGTRMAIWQEFERLLQSDLSMAEQQFLRNSIAECTTKKCKHGCKGTCKHNQPPPVFQLTGNASFTSLRGFFDANVSHDDTMTPLQREVIRLAQILKSRLVTEMELKQRVMERSVIEERLGPAEEQADQLKRERDAIASLRTATQESLKFRSTLLPSLTKATSDIDSRFREYRIVSQSIVNKLSELSLQICKSQDGNSSLPKKFERVLALIAETAPYRSAVANSGQKIDSKIVKLNAPKVSLEFGLDLLRIDESTRELIDRIDKIDGTDSRTEQDRIDKLFYLGGTSAKKTDLQLLVSEISTGLDKLVSLTKQFRDEKDLSASLIKELQLRFAKSKETTNGLATKEQSFAIISVYDVRVSLEQIAQLLSIQGETANALDEVGKSKLELLSFVDSIFSSQQGEQINTKQATRAYQEWIGLEQKIWNLYKGKNNSYDFTSLNDTRTAFELWIKKVSELDADRSIAQSSRRPLDHKKFLDMLIDDLEEKYIELLEGTRAHTANIDNYLKRLTTSLDDDFNTQFYYPVFRSVRKASQNYKVEFGQTETTNVLANNRELAKVSPAATMEFDLPKRDILIKEGIDSALAIYNDVGALVNDPNLMSLAKMQSGQSTASPGAGTLGGYGAVRNVYPGLGNDTTNRLVSQNAGSGPKFESNVEKLIPDPAIYKFETGTGYEIRPVIAPDGQAVVFDFNYMYTTQVREPVRADEKHLGRIKQHYIDTDVQLSNFELREVSRYVVALKAARTAKGVPLLEDIPVVGGLWRPLPSDEKSLQQNIIMAQATIFPTLFDLMGLRWAPAVSDMDPMRLSNREYIVRNRHKFLENRIYDYSSARVDEFLRVPDPARRADLYRSQETIPQVHPNGYQGPGLDIEVSPMRNGYDPQVQSRSDLNIPSASPEGALYPSNRNNDPRNNELRGDPYRNGVPPTGAFIEDVQPMRLDSSDNRRGGTLPSPAPQTNSGWEYSHPR